ATFGNRHIVRNCGLVFLSCASFDLGLLSLYELQQRNRSLDERSVRVDSRVLSQRPRSVVVWICPASGSENVPIIYTSGQQFPVLVIFNNDVAHRPSRSILTENKMTTTRHCVCPLSLDWP